MVLSLQIKTAVLVVVLGLAVLSVLPLFSEPYYHKFKVNFWVWANRELEELLTGERDV